MPSPLAERPGLLMRDPFHYSDATLIIPPVLVACLEHFDGTQSELELRASLVRLTGDLDVGEIARHLHDTLSRAGFLEDSAYREQKEAAERRFAEQPDREPRHSGSAYPEEPAKLSEVLGGYFREAGAAQEQLGTGLWPATRHEDGVAGETQVTDSPISQRRQKKMSVPEFRRVGKDRRGPSGCEFSGQTIGIAAPHVSPEGGWQSYASAYDCLSPADADRTFVVLGTSHYGEPDRFGLTRKPFVTPFGRTATAIDLADRLAKAAPQSVRMEDYCHSVEHSIEFQVVFLQHLFGPAIRILPILCGPFAHSLYYGGLPEHTEEVARFLDALSELYAREGSRLCFILGIDMAHIGRRYGDEFAAKAFAGKMQEVEARDRERILRAGAGDPAGFWELVRPNRDELKWCGSSPLYTFLKIVPGVRGELQRYQQWNIDESSVVSFGALSFRTNQKTADGRTGGPAVPSAG